MTMDRPGTTPTGSAPDSWAICPSAPWFARAHKLEARFDYRPPDILNGENIPVSAIRALSSQTYVGDRCVRCGAFFGRGA